MKKYSLYLSIALLFTLYACTNKPATTANETPLADSLKGTFWDYTLPVNQRVDDLVSKLTLEEKVSQMMHVAPAINRLGIPEYYWWNECLHGLARAGQATVFPQAIGIAATFNEELVYQMAEAISDEARAKHHLAVKNGTFQQYMGLNFWSPNVNIFRDPRWGRGQETYGEDPYLTSRMGVAFVKGLQGTDTTYYKVIATPKHYAVHSGPEPDRHRFNAVASLKDMYETYLPAFEATIVEGKAGSIMGAYNRTNGEPCCASPTLLTDILRKKWNFKGFVVSDCDAINDFWTSHKIVPDMASAAALGVKEGCDLNCGSAYEGLLEAVKKGLITEADIDVTLKRLFTARIKLGMFDPASRVSYTQIDSNEIENPEHKQIALQMARESMVLLKNKNSILPLRKNLKSIAIIGPTGSDLAVLYGNYYGNASDFTSILEGITKKVSKSTRVLDFKGMNLTSVDTSNFQTVRHYIAAEADVLIAVMGLSPELEGEEMPVDLDGFYKGDRTKIGLPGVQEGLLKACKDSGKPVILVLTGGSPIAVNWAQENVDAIVMAWYPGESGGQAVADVLFGDYNPSGHLPITFPKSVEQLPPFDDYSMKGRTYRYMEAEPLYPFGFGLSYTTFAFEQPQLSKQQIKVGESINLKVVVKNTGKFDANQVAQLYLTDLEASTRTPFYALKAFKRVYLKSGESKKVSFTITPAMMQLITDQGEAVIEPGKFRAYVADATPSARSLVLGASKPATADFEVIK